MYKGFKKIGSDTYYFTARAGVMATGWVTNSKKGYKYYFDPSTGVMATGTKTIDGKKYTFGSNGVLDTNPSTTTETSSRTIKNFLANALLPGRKDSLRMGRRPQLVGCDQKGHQSKMETVV